MLGWAVSFLIAAVSVALLGSAEAATTLAVMSKVLFWVFILGLVVSVAMYFGRSSPRAGDIRRNRFRNRARL